MTDEWMAEIGSRIEIARKQAKMSRPMLADILEAHTNTLTKYERGERGALKAVKVIAEATDCDLRWLLHGHSYQDPLESLERRLVNVEVALRALAEAQLQLLGRELEQGPNMTQHRRRRGDREPVDADGPAG